ncbi:MAG: aminoglycoside phosphotransferase family protein [Pirellulales bacterium]
MIRDDACRLDGVCAAWGHGRLRSWMPLAATGFSGASLYVVSFADVPGRFVLKPFAANVPRQRAEWVHQLMHHARHAGVTEVPQLLTTAAGGSVGESEDGGLWELVEFVEGQPCASPTSAQAAAALVAVARVHGAVASWPGAVPDHGPSRGVVRRMEQARNLLGRSWATRLEAADSRDGTAELAQEVRALCRDADRILAGPLGRRSLTAVAEAGIGAVHRQAVLRDIWSDHVLFDPMAPARVAGIVDFHAAGIDTPLADLARLLGSWEIEVPLGLAVVPSLADRWAEPLAAYEQASGRSLAAADRWLCGWLSASAVICSLDNWFRWILEENRHFADASRVLARIRRLLVDLPAAVEWLSHAAKLPV